MIEIKDSNGHGNGGWDEQIEARLGSEAQRQVAAPVFSFTEMRRLHEDLKAAARHFQSSLSERSARQEQESEGSARALTPVIEFARFVSQPRGATYAGTGATAAGDAFAEPHRAASAAKQVDRGSVKFLAGLVRIWGITNQEVGCLLGLEETETFRLFGILSGATPIVGRDLKDRIAALLDIRSVLASRYDGDVEAERDWLRRQVADLEGKSPLETIDEGSIESLLLVRDYLMWTAGH